MKKISFYLTLSLAILTSCQKESSNSLIDEEGLVVPIFDTLPQKIDSCNNSQQRYQLAISGGEHLIRTSDCLSCHHQKSQLVGPSFEAIKNKYPSTPSNIEALAARIIEGGSGSWGSIPMQAHPTLSKKEAEEMIQYILSTAL